MLEINSSVFGEENVDDSNWNEVDGLIVGFRPESEGISLEEAYKKVKKL